MVYTGNFKHHMPIICCNIDNIMQYASSADDGRIALALSNHSCLVEIKGSKIIDNGTWEFFTGVGEDPQNMKQFQTTYTVTIKGAFPR